jgi:hypothetical protein
LKERGRSENAKLRNVLADGMLDNAALNDLLAKKNGGARCQAEAVAHLVLRSI